MLFRPVCPFRSNSVGRPSGAHRHGISSPTDIITHQPHRGNADGCGGGGEAG